MHPLLARLLEGRDGLRVIGDVHGHFVPFAEAVDGAMRRNLAILSLGDLPNRGPDSPRTMQLGTALVAERWGVIVPGNHDARHLRLVHGGNVRVASNGPTSAVHQLACHADGAAISRRYAETLAAMPVWLTAGPYLFAHGGFAPEMLVREPPRLGAVSGRDELVHRALSGESDGTRDAKGRCARTYGWLDLVPAGITVCIGHDVVSTTEIVTRKGAHGGRVMHIDTGAGKGGRLSWIDLPIEELVRVPESRMPSILIPEAA